MSGSISNQQGSAAGRDLSAADIQRQDPRNVRGPVKSLERIQALLRAENPEERLQRLRSQVAQDEAQDFRSRTVKTDDVRTHQYYCVFLSQVHGVMGVDDFNASNLDHNKLFPASTTLLKEYFCTFLRWIAEVLMPRTNTRGATKIRPRTLEKYRVALERLLNRYLKSLGLEEAERRLLTYIRFVMPEINHSLLVIYRELDQNERSKPFLDKAATRLLVDSVLKSQSISPVKFQQVIVTLLGFFCGLRPGSICAQYQDETIGQSRPAHIVLEDLKIHYGVNQRLTLSLSVRTWKGFSHRQSQIRTFTIIQPQELNLLWADLPSLVIILLKFRNILRQPLEYYLDPPSTAPNVVQLDAPTNTPLFLAGSPRGLTLVSGHAMTPRQIQSTFGSMVREAGFDPDVTIYAFRRRFITDTAEHAGIERTQFMAGQIIGGNTAYTSYMNLSEGVDLVAAALNIKQLSSEEIMARTSQAVTKMKDTVRAKLELEVLQQMEAHSHIQELRNRIDDLISRGVTTEVQENSLTELGIAKQQLLSRSRVLRRHIRETLYQQHYKQQQADVTVAEVSEAQKAAFEQSLEQCQSIITRLGLSATHDVLRETDELSLEQDGARDVGALRAQAAENDAGPDEIQIEVDELGQHPRAVQVQDLGLRVKYFQSILDSIMTPETELHSRCPMCELDDSLPMAERSRAYLPGRLREHMAKKKLHSPEAVLKRLILRTIRPGAPIQCPFCEKTRSDMSGILKHIYGGGPTVPAAHSLWSELYGITCHV